MITTTVAEDLSSVSVTEDGLLECLLPNYNPETLVPFASEEEVLDYAASVEGREFFWVPKLSDEEKAQIAFDGKALQVRTERNQKLVQSDWTQIADAAVDKAAWAAYRQALRDITAQAGFPWDVSWPEHPL